MRAKSWVFVGMGLIAAIGWTSAPWAADTPSAAGAPRAADEAAIRKLAAEFAEAFNRGDAAAVASHWTAEGESREADGQVFKGREAIAKVYAEIFRQRPGQKIEVLVQSVRFPARDMAIEEGLLRLTTGPTVMPTSSAYTAIHAREDGRWKIAYSTEEGVGQDRLEDLEWLIGTWVGRVPTGEVKFVFTRSPDKPQITGTFTKTTPNKPPVGGTMRIALDPETRRVRSWSFEDDGAHAQSFWFNDGKSWLLDSRGVLADGSPASEVIVLQRTQPDVITWRSIDRVLGGNRLPDTTPLRLTRGK